MIKSILNKAWWISVVILLLPVFAGADAGIGEFYDVDKALSFKVSTEQEEVAFGEYLSFTIELRNNTTYPIPINSTNIWWPPTYNKDINIDISDITVEPGTRVTLDLEYLVPEEVDWYKMDDAYYFDLDLTISYEAKATFVYKFEVYENEYCWFEQDQSKPIPIKLTNLHEGEAYIDVEIITERDVFEVYAREVRPYENYEYYEAELYISNILRITNTSQNTIYLGDTALFSGGAYETLRNSSTMQRLESAKKTPQTHTAVYRIAFKIDDQMYAVEKSLDYPVSPLGNQVIESRVTKENSDTEGYIDYTVKLRNKSNRTIYGFYTVFGYDNLDTFSEEQYFGSFEHDQILEETITLKKGDPLEFYWGSKSNDIIQIYGQYILNNGTKLDIGEHEYGFYISYDIPIDNYDYSYVRYIPNPNRPVPTLRPLVLPSTTPAPVSTIKPVPTVNVVNETKRVESIPDWVIIVLPVVIALVAAVIIHLRKTGKLK